MTRESSPVGKTVLVTGGAGYIGSLLVGELLATGRSVRVLDSLHVGDGSSLRYVWGRERFGFIRGDVGADQLRRRALEGVDSVVHLAAVVGDPACGRDPEAARSVNLDATLALLDDARDAGVSRFVFASTCSNYGKMEDSSLLANEDWELRPVSLYAETKVAAELEVLSRATSQLAPVCLRFATVYGTSTRMRFDLTVNEFARDALVEGKIVVYGEQFWRPYVHVRDVGRAVITVLNAVPAAVSGQVFNVGATDQNFRKQDLIDIILERLPATVVERVEQHDDPRDYRVSFDRVREQLGFQTSWTVPQGVDEILSALEGGTVSDPFSAEYRN